MIANLSAPYSLTDEGFVFILHNPELENFSADWDQSLCDPANLHDGLAFAIDQRQSLYLLRFSSLLSIAVSLDKKTIDLWPEISLTQEDLKHILIDQLVPRIFAAQEKLVLHAGAVVIGDRAVAFMGESGAGKSTLTASLHLQGLSLLNDDAVVVSNANNTFFANVSHHRLRLLPDSRTELFAGYPKLQPVSRITAKSRIVITDGKRHEKTDFPLGALFFIGNKSAQHVSLRKLAPAEAVMTIIANSFALNPTVPEFAAANLQRACALAEHVPAYELNYPRTYDALPDVHQKIFSKLDELQR